MQGAAAPDERAPLVGPRRRVRWPGPLLVLACVAAFAVHRSAPPRAAALAAAGGGDGVVVFPTLVTQQAFLEGPAGAQRMVVSWGHRTDDAVAGFDHDRGNMVQGPTRRVTAGARVSVTLKNALMSDSTSVHHHGIHQVGTPYFDGSQAISQSGLPPGHTMDYAFAARPYGTHWYHSHTGMQYGDGLKGLFIVEDPDDPYVARGDYAHEDALLFSEWETRGAYEGWTINIRAPLADDAVWGKTVMPAGLVNGVPSQTADLEATPGYVVEVAAGSTARLRLCYGGFNFRFHVRIRDHAMTVIAKDGTYVEPVATDLLAVYAAERYDVLVDAAATPGDYAIEFVALMHGHFLGVVGAMNATLRVTAPAAAGRRSAKNVPVRDRVDLGFDAFSLKSDMAYAPAVPAAADRALRFVITAAFATEEPQDGQARLENGNAVPDGASDRQFWAVNNESWVDPAAPLYVTKGRAGVSSENGYDTTRLIQRIDAGEVVDLVVVNRGTGSDPMYHPLHLHGYKFWVVAAGALPVPDDPDYDVAAPLYADTFPVYTGHYAIFRVKFDNVGMWHFHCHLLFHMGLGLQVVFNVGEADQPDPPQDYFDSLSPFSTSFAS